MICIFNWGEFIYGTFEDYLGLLILTIAHFISESLLAVPHPDVFWYRWNGMSAQKMGPKSSCNTFPTYISRKS